MEIMYQDRLKFEKILFSSTSNRNTLQAAEVLVQKLNSEYSSWNEQLDALNNELENLVKKAYLIALAMTHLSQYTYENRM